MIKIGTALFEACEELERERGISKDVLIASLNQKEIENIAYCIQNLNVKVTNYFQYLQI